MTLNSEQLYGRTPAGTAPFTWRSLMNHKLGKTSGRAQRAPPPYLEIPDASPPLAPCLGSFRRLPLDLLRCPGRAGAPGCGHQAKVDFSTVSKPPTVQVINPPVRNIVRVVGQPSFIEAFERTSIFPKLTVISRMESRHWRQGEEGPAAGLPVRARAVKRITRRKRRPSGSIKSELSWLKRSWTWPMPTSRRRRRLKEAKAILDKYEAEVVRWGSEVKRLDHEVKRGIVDPQILLESQNQLRASNAARDAAKATIEKAEAELLSDQATLSKAVVDVKVAEAAWLVAQSEEKRLKAWVGYLTLPAPFDGVVVARNANTFDSSCPPRATPPPIERSPHLLPARAAPIYVVDRTDVVRIFVDIPEQDANYVQIGTKATVVAKAYRDHPIPGSVTRTSWALNVKSRTLRAEIDLPNPNSQLLPGMYAYAKVIIERPACGRCRCLPSPTAARRHSAGSTRMAMR